MREGLVTRESRSNGAAARRAPEPPARYRREGQAPGPRPVRPAVAQHVVAQHVVAQHVVAQHVVAQHVVAQRPVAQRSVVQGPGLPHVAAGLRRSCSAGRISGRGPVAVPAVVPGAAAAQGRVLVGRPVPAHVLRRRRIAAGVLLALATAAVVVLLGLLADVAAAARVGEAGGSGVTTTSLTPVSPASGQVGPGVWR